MKTLMLILTLLLLLYLLAGLWLYFNQRKLLYFPTDPVETPYESMTIQNQGEQIHITITHPGQPHALLYFGGNNEAAAADAEAFAKALPHYSTYLVDYRGYGHSSGTPTEAGIFSDALALYDAIAPKHHDVSLFGRSLGTGVACFVAAEREVKKLALITPYDSIVRVAADRYPIFPLSLLVKDKYDSLSRVPRIHAQTLVLIAQHDTVVPKKHAYRLAEAFPPQQIEVYEIEGSRHNDIAQTVAYEQILERFFHDERIFSAQAAKEH